MKIRKSIVTACLISATVAIVGIQTAQACTRVVHTSKDGSRVVTGRNMDWFEDTQSNLWLFPRSMKRNGSVKDNSLQWVSKYGSVITAGFDVGTTDGLNEKGLMVNLLYLAESDFGERDISKKGISWSAYVQYILDQFATVKEAVEALTDDQIQVVSSPLPGSSSKAPTLHFSLSDATGDSAIFEHIDGKLIIHHDKKYKVMTNSPTYDQQLALNAYWETVGGDAMLPGTSRAAERFVRASFYVNQLPDPKTDRQAIANVMSVMRNASVPFGATDPDQPNIAPTVWRSAADHVNKIYYFESTLSPNIVWVKLDDLDFNPGASVKKLVLVGHYEFNGNVSNKFEDAKPFVFAGTK